MRKDDFRRKLQETRLVASVQTSPGSPVEDRDTLLRLAQASLASGVRVLRLQGAETVAHIRRQTRATVIGLIKREYEGFEPYITPSMTEVQDLLTTGCEVIALDGTARQRPGGQSLADLISAIHAHGKLAMADCDTLASVRYAVESGADLVGTTLSGYTPDTLPQSGPDLALVRAAVAEGGAVVIAEGRYAEDWQVQAALRAGATAVVIGGALNDPVKLTQRFLSASRRPAGYTGAVDLGGTWLRWGLFDSDWRLLDTDRVELPRAYTKRQAWLRSKFAEHRPKRVGISAGGVIASDGFVSSAKGFIPNYVGRPVAQLRTKIVAMNDGLATAWGHACLPQFAGLRVATVALGSGVGMGVALRDDVVTNRHGDYPRLNDLTTRAGTTFEEILGGLQLGADPSPEARAEAIRVGREAIETVQSLFMPDVTVVAGGVGLSDWFGTEIQGMDGVVASPFGADAGLYGAAALALWPPRCRQEGLE